MNTTLPVGAASPEQAANRRILIVDDSRAIHEDFRKILEFPGTRTNAFDDTRMQVFGEASEAEEEGFEISSVFQGEEAIEANRKAIEEGRPFAMAFVDVRMPPGLDGIETTKRLWEQDPELQVVICTAYSDYSWQAMLKETGASDQLLILKKPFDTIEVLQLAHSITKKWTLGRAVTNRLADLDVLVNERTHQLVTSNERLREQASLLDNARDAIMVQDLEGVIAYWNASAERLYGWSAAEAIGSKAQEILHAAGDSEHRSAIEQLMEKGGWIGELRHRTKSGSEITVEGHWTLVRDEMGRPKSLLAINTDVTARKLLESQFLRAQRMESIGVLAGGIAHDLNNILGPIMMGVEVLQSRLGDDESRRILDVLEKSATRGAGMVKQVLQFARGTEGERMLIQPEYVVREIRKVTTNIFPKAINVQVNVAPGLWLISADATQLHQVLLNLSVNARDAMPAGGSLAIAAQNVTLDATCASMMPGAHPGSYVIFKVADNGAGMPPEVAARMFEPFFTTKEEGKGTGLGLSTTLGIVKSHGGFIEVESKVGEGTTIKVYLPAATDAQAAPQPSVTAELPRGRGELVMVVDDEEAVRVILTDTLRDSGYRVVAASDGAEACSIYAQQKDVSAVLTDLVMPILDGPSTIRALRSMNPDLPIIAATGQDAGPELALLAEQPVEALLAKPYRTEALLITLRDCLDRHAGGTAISGSSSVS